MLVLPPEGGGLTLGVGDGEAIAGGDGSTLGILLLHDLLIQISLGV